MFNNAASLPPETVHNSRDIPSTARGLDIVAEPRLWALERVALGADGDGGPKLGQEVVRERCAVLCLWVVVLSSVCR